MRLTSRCFNRGSEPIVWANGETVDLSPTPDAVRYAGNLPQSGRLSRAEFRQQDSSNDESTPIEHGISSLYHLRKPYPHPSTRSPYNPTPLRMSSAYHVHEQETADTPAEQIAVDGSAGSDTDTGAPLKADAAGKDDSDTPHHARSNSVKKPTTFKAVSVTKNFLAKAGTPTAPAAKTNGDIGEYIFHKLVQTAADKSSP